MTERDPRIPKPIDPNDGPIILLDMDGVCVNFVKGVCEAVGRDYDATLKTWPKGEYDICKVLDVPPDDIWKVIGTKGRGFWKSLEPYPWFSKLYRLLSDLWPQAEEAKVFFATSPSWTPSSFSGKILWLQDRFGHEFCNYVFTPHKTLLARPFTVLIDDNDEHVEAFKRAGGAAILFPQPWNTAPETEDAVHYTMNKIYPHFQRRAMADMREGKHGA